MNLTANKIVLRSYLNENGCATTTEVMKTLEPLFEIAAGRKWSLAYYQDVDLKGLTKALSIVTDQKVVEIMPFVREGGKKYPNLSWSEVKKEHLTLAHFEKRWQGWVPNNIWQKLHGSQVNIFWDRVWMNLADDLWVLLGNNLRGVLWHNLKPILFYYIGFHFLGHPQEARKVAKLLQFLPECIPIYTRQENPAVWAVLFDS